MFETGSSSIHRNCLTIDHKASCASQFTNILEADKREKANVFWPSVRVNSDGDLNSNKQQKIIRARKLFPINTRISVVAYSGSTSFVMYTHSVVLLSGSGRARRRRRDDVRFPDIAYRHNAAGHETRFVPSDNSAR